MLSKIKYASLIVPPVIFIKNRIGKGRVSPVLPEKKHIVVIGGGIVGLTTSFFLS